MPIIEISPQDMPSAVALEGGAYGPGQANPAEVKLAKFSYNELAANPGYDRDGEQGPWAKLLFIVILPSGEQGFTQLFVNDLGVLASHLTNAGVQVARGEGV